MPKLLFINACVRPRSRTRQLAQVVLDSLRGDVEEVDLEKEKIPALTNQGLERRAKALAQGGADQPDLRYARQFIAADVIVIAAPYWDLSFPASLKDYLEAVNVVDLTFRYTQSGEPEGLCRAKRLYYVTTAGGYIYEGNMGFEYVKALCQTFYGIDKVVLFKAEGLDIVGADVEAIMASAKEAVATQMAET